LIKPLDFPEAQFKMLFAFALIALASAQKPVLYPNGVENSFDFTSILPLPTFSTTLLSAVPQQCIIYDDGQAGPNCPVAGEFSAVNITLSSCQTPWTACHCAISSGINLQDALQFYAQTPTYLRDHIRYLATFAAVTQESIGTNSDVILFANSTGSFPALTALLEAASENIDQGLSSSAAWQNAVNADSCVADSDANNSLQTAFAKANVVFLFHQLTGTFPSGNALDPSCASNQLNFIGSQSTLGASAIAETQCDVAVRATNNHP
jgi:hypothetical protein